MPKGVQGSFLAVLRVMQGLELGHRMTSKHLPLLTDPPAVGKFDDKHD